MELHGVLSEALAHACGIASAVFGWLGIGALAWGGARAVTGLLRARLNEQSQLQARLDLGKHVALGLEFLVARDVLDSIVDPGWDELGKLAAIVVLRTAIQLSLARELREIAADPA